MFPSIFSTAGSCAAATSSGSNNNSGGLNLHHASDSSDSGCALEEYTWVPNGLRPQQVRHPSAISPNISHWGVTKMYVRRRAEDSERLATVDTYSSSSGENPFIKTHLLRMKLD